MRNPRTAPTRRMVILISALALIAAACSDDTSTTTSSTTTSTSTSSSTTTTTTTTTTTSSSTTSTTSAPPAPTCDDGEPLAVVDAALATARLTAPADWSADPASTSFADLTSSGADYADRAGLDCGALVGADDEVDQWVAIAAWTGPRMIFSVLTSAVPSEPYRAETNVRTPLDDIRGEFLDEDMTLWAAPGPDGGSIVIGHVDFNLGVAAKDWAPGPWPNFEPEVNVPAEQHGLDVLVAAGMRNVGIAQPAEFGSEEGYVQFISPTGQISVADIAPTDWFDPMLPRYYTGESTIETINGVDVRVTLPDPEDNLGFILAAEVAFACDAFVWILEPPFNGTVEEMVATATAVTATTECRAG